MGQGYRHIRELPLGERPREKMAASGPAVLSDLELLAVLIGSGTRRYPLLEICGALLELTGKDLARLPSLPFSEIAGLGGLGKARALTLLAAAELGRRCHMRLVPLVLADDQSVSELIRPYLTGEQALQYHLVMLNRDAELLATARLVSAAVTFPDLKHTVRLCLDAGASCLLLCRNELPLTKDYVDNEEAFMVRLREALSVFGMEMRRLVVV